MTTCFSFLQFEAAKVNKKICLIFIKRNNPSPEMKNIRTHKISSILTLKAFETEEKGGRQTFYESGEVKSNNSISEVN